MTKIVNIEQALSVKEFATTKVEPAQFLRAIAEEVDLESESMDDATNPTELCRVVHSAALKLAEVPGASAATLMSDNCEHGVQAVDRR